MEQSVQRERTWALKQGMGIHHKAAATTVCAPSVRTHLTSRCRVPAPAARASSSHADSKCRRMLPPPPPGGERGGGIKRHSTYRRYQSKRPNPQEANSKHTSNNRRSFPPLGAAG